jgi:octaprenyl-diphosphate synthase
MALLGKHRALDDTVERARHYGSIARDALGIFPDNEVKHALLDVVDFCIERAY